MHKECQQKSADDTARLMTANSMQNSVAMQHKRGNLGSESCHHFRHYGNRNQRREHDLVGNDYQQREDSEKTEDGQAWALV